MEAAVVTTSRGFLVGVVGVEGLLFVFGLDGS
jgi:hypothetical protein